jgi:hypothetical protein
VADPFHLVKLANSKLDECRRRVQNDTLGHRGRKGDPLYRARRLLTKAHERLDEDGDQKLRGLLEAGDPRGEVRTARHAKEVVRSIYDIPDIEVAGEFVDQLAADLQDESRSPEVRSLGRTIMRWCDQIVAWHDTLVSNGPTEAANNLIKRIKRIGFGFRRFAHYRIRVLLYAGRPNRHLLAPPSHPLKSDEPDCCRCDEVQRPMTRLRGATLMGSMTPCRWAMTSPWTRRVISANTLPSRTATIPAPPANGSDSRVVEESGP